MADPKLYRRGNVWYTWIQGERHSTKCRDRKSALVAARNLEFQHTQVQADSTTHQTETLTRSPALCADRFLSDAINAFLEERKQRGRSDGTLNCYQTKARQLLRILGNLPILQVDAELVDSYTGQRIKQGAARNTIGKELTTLRGILTLARRRKWYPHDPRAVLPSGWSLEYQPRRRFLQREEAEALLHKLAQDKPHRAAWVALALATGARRSEVEKIRREDVRMQDGKIRIRGTKTDKAERWVPILSITQPFAVAALAWGAHQGPLVQSWSSVCQDLPRALKSLGYEKATPNDLRRTLATWLRSAGVDTSLIAELLGHVDSRMVERVYGRLSLEQLGASIEKSLGSSRPQPAP